MEAVESSGLKLAHVVDMPPYHYGAVFEQSYPPVPMMPSILDNNRILRRLRYSCLGPCCARRADKKGLLTASVPPVCILDPDGGYRSRA